MAGLTRRVLTGGGLVLGLALAIVNPALAEPPVPHIIVQGTGEVEAAPDLAWVNLGVEVQEHTAVAANRAASARMRAVLAVLSENGVASADIQTSGLSLNPVYERQRNDLNRPPRVVGFEARNTLRVTVRDLAQLGPLLDAVIADGANMFRGLSFGLEDSAAAENAARRAAMADALSKAQVLTEAAGVSTGPILSIVESGADRGRPEFAARMAMSDASVPVAPGSLTIRSQVTLELGLSQ